MKMKFVVLFGFLILFINNASAQISRGDGNSNLCAIESNPEVFLEKPLDVKAIYFAGFEMGWLEGTDSCAPRQTRIAYKFDENYETDTEAKVLKRMNKILSQKIKKPTDIRKVQGVFRIQVTKHKKRNEKENLYDYDITVLKIVSVDQSKK